MTKTKKYLSIIASDRNVKKHLEKSVRDVIGHLLDIKCYSLDDNIAAPLYSDLVVTTGNFLEKEAKKLFPDSKVINGKIVITGFNLEKIIMLPNNTKALIVSNPKEMSEEIGEILNEFGINHVNFEYYWKGKNVDWKKIDVVITPGVAHLCPNIFKDIIDIGYRSLSVKTFAEILNYFDLDLKYLEIFENKYIRLHVDTCSKVSLSLLESEKFRRNQNTILQTIDEGIIQVNKNNDILIANSIAKDIFNISDTNPYSDDLVKVINIFDNSLKEKHINQNTIVINIKNNDYYCTKNIVEMGNEALYLFTFKKVVQIQELEHDLRRKLHHKGHIAKYTFDNIWGNNVNILKMKNISSQFAKNDLSILITGESGTGKEVLAQSIHNSSKRAHGPFLAVNFAAIPDNLVESELFGYEEGAFTGARRGGKQGFFELAHKGTIFLDEIGDASHRVQTILLRVLEERQITRVGGEKSIPIDVRIIAATNKSLEDMISCNKFREDLYYRLCMLPIKTIPLREMKNEIPYFINRYLIENYDFDNNIVIDPKVFECIQSHNWPGNFRELKNVINYMYYSSIENDRVCLKDLPKYLCEKFIVKSDLNLDYIENTDSLEKIKTNPVLFDILYLFDKMSPNAVGRYKITEYLNKQENVISEGDVRKCLRILEDENLISTGTTRQGSTISKKGQDLLNYILYS